MQLINSTKRRSELINKRKVRSLSMRELKRLAKKKGKLEKFEIWKKRLEEKEEEK